MLEPSGIHSSGRQCVSGRMPQHVDMHREQQSSGLASPFNHARDTHTTERLAALIDEYVGPLIPSACCCRRRSLRPFTSSRSR
jgi:hypothetical protein